MALDIIREECKTEIRKWLGSRIVGLVVGGAALNPKVKDFLIEVFSYAKNDNFSFPIEVTQHEAKEYFNTGIYLCVFEFSVPENAEKLLINLFKT